jgi:hypothetical protein
MSEYRDIVSTLQGSAHPQWISTCRVGRINYQSTQLSVSTNRKWVPHGLGIIQSQSVAYLEGAMGAARPGGIFMWCHICVCYISLYRLH